MTHPTQLKPRAMRQTTTPTTSRSIDVHRRTVLIAGITAAGGLLPSVAAAQQWPVKPIRLIVPFPPGAAGDLIPRLVGQKLSERLNQAIVVENRVGAGGNIGTQLAARAPADGYTFLAVPGSTLTINPSVYKDTGFNPLKDFTPISQLAQAPFMLAIHPSLNIRSVQELVRRAKASPVRLTFASSGNGTTSHLAGLLFSSATSTEFVHVPYRGGGPATADLVAGQVSMMFATVGALLPFIRSGKLMPLAVTGAERAPQLPDIPTMAETGVPIEIGDWIAMLAPASTPEHIARAMEEALQDIFKNPEIIKDFKDRGFAPPVTGALALSKIMSSDLQKWAQVVSRADVKVD